ncbi:hypothetical protein [Paenibacillus sp. Soil787]|uniref:hypothetical protein n=1 Tax=Paenibacillus sp. Soil787 TaxID=1736411 RepID=UPI00070334A3|nr:hypothetical protein [Paenibacillus sp. Soil787]KRF27658.1 hypothetical protein ASG93_29385 [Paenibacillus sp. Soil787]
MVWKVLLVISLVFVNVVLASVLLWKYEMRQDYSPTVKEQTTVAVNSAKNAQNKVDNQPQNEMKVEQTKQNLTDEQKIQYAIQQAVTRLQGINVYKRNQRYVVEAEYTLEDGPLLKSAAEKVARDFTFSAYATGLPLARTSIIINKPTGIVGLVVSVGNNQASTQPASTWTDAQVGPTLFMNWVKQHANSDYKNIENHTAVKDNF